MDFLSLNHYFNVIEKDLELLKSKGFDFKNHSEIESFRSFTNYLINSNKLSSDYYSYTSDFNYGYVIPQLGKEFDLLRIGTNYNVNIEIKSQSTYEKSVKQLNRNYFYLKYLDIPTYYFSFNVDKNELLMGYASTECDSLTITLDENSEGFWKVLKEQQYRYYSSNQIDYLFDVSNYLVSPFNDTDKFLKNQYILSPQQENIKKDILNTQKSTFLIDARPGTGKSLLMLDMAKYLLQNYPKEKILMIHTGILNSGHLSLIKEDYNILPIKQFSEGLENNPNYIFIDESQRIDIIQLKDIINYINEANAKLIVFMDKDQTLKSGEVPKKVISTLEENCFNKLYKYDLSVKFRNNSQMASFIAKMTKIPIDIDPSFLVNNKNKNIDIKYFDSQKKAANFFSYLRNANFKVLGYTASRITPDPFDNTPLGDINAHRAIGQEYDNVAVIIDENFQYRQENNFHRLMGTRRSYYSSYNMFYQNITRVRKKLTVIVINNIDVFTKICSILDHL